jgi:hypothetical protein
LLGSRLTKRDRHGKQRTEEQPEQQKRSKVDAERKAFEESRKEEVLIGERRFNGADEFVSGCEA